MWAIAIIFLVGVAVLTFGVISGGQIHGINKVFNDKIIKATWQNRVWSVALIWGAFFLVVAVGLILVFSN